MIKNYLKIAFRNLLRNKIFSFINIVGLSIGLCIAILIGLWVWDEISFNKVHDNHASLGEVLSIEKFKGAI